VPSVLDVPDAERLDPLPDDEVRVERLRPQRKVAERVARDLDAERGEPALLLGEEARVVADDRVHRHSRSIARADIGAHRTGREGAESLRRDAPLRTHLVSSLVGAIHARLERAELSSLPRA